ncbi:MAG: hypothetical protein CM15mP109_05300 [Candidatus Dadabacteria bacterium]|nr:MAG: hypothetical protein CM15mP109_05300 [Candidatus Dadabacteria bacterium]
MPSGKKEKDIRLLLTREKKGESEPPQKEIVLGITL